MDHLHQGILVTTQDWLAFMPKTPTNQQSEKTCLNGIFILQALCILYKTCATLANHDSILFDKDALNKSTINDSDTLWMPAANVSMDTVLLDGNHVSSGSECGCK